MDEPEIIEARHVLDAAMVERALANVTPDDVSALRTGADLTLETEGLEAGFTQYAALLAVARTPVLQAFVRAVGQLGMGAVLRSTLTNDELGDVLRSIRLTRRQQIEAVIAGDVGAAMANEASILDNSSRLLQSARLSPNQDRAQARDRALRFLSIGGRFKRPELLMHEIASDIVAAGWPVGRHLGTEAELLVHYGVSRSAFREAVRSLEQIGVVEMKTGRQSGLKVGSPSPDTIIAACRRQFGRIGVRRAHLRDAFYAIGTACAALAADQAEDGASLLAYVDNGPAPFFSHMAMLSRNRILSLMMMIIVTPSMSAGEPVDPRVHAPGPEELAEIARAIMASDSAMARRLVLHLHHRSEIAGAIGERSPH